MWQRLPQRKEITLGRESSLSNGWLDTNCGASGWNPRKDGLDEDLKRLETEQRKEKEQEIDIETENSMGTAGVVWPRFDWTHCYRNDQKGSVIARQSGFWRGHEIKVRRAGYKRTWSESSIRRRKSQTPWCNRIAAERKVKERSVNSRILSYQGGCHRTRKLHTGETRPRKGTAKAAPREGSEASASQGREKFERPGPRGRRSRFGRTPMGSPASAVLILDWPSTVTGSGLPPRLQARSDPPTVQPATTRSRYGDNRHSLWAWGLHHPHPSERASRIARQAAERDRLHWHGIESGRMDFGPARDEFSQSAPSFTLGPGPPNPQEQIVQSEKEIATNPIRHDSSATG